MPTNALLSPDAIDTMEQLRLLEVERALAGLMGLDQNQAYLDDLRRDLVAARAAFVGAAVTEIACLRAALDAPLDG